MTIRLAGATLPQEATESRMGHDIGPFRKAVQGNVGAARRIVTYGQSDVLDVGQNANRLVFAGAKRLGTSQGEIDIGGQSMSGSGDICMSTYVAMRESELRERRRGGRDLTRTWRRGDPKQHGAMPRVEGGRHAARAKPPRKRRGSDAAPQQRSDGSDGALATPALISPLSWRRSTAGGARRRARTHMTRSTPR